MISIVPSVELSSQITEPGWWINCSERLSSCCPGSESCCHCDRNHAYWCSEGGRSRRQNRVSVVNIQNFGPEDGHRNSRVGLCSVPPPPCPNRTAARPECQFRPRLSPSQRRDASRCIRYGWFNFDRFQSAPVLYLNDRRSDRSRCMPVSYRHLPNWESPCHLTARR